MQPQPIKGTKPAAKPGLVGDPANDMTATFAWGGAGVTITFPAGDFYADETSQSWTWNGTTRPEAAATRSDTFGTYNATGNTLTVVQNRPSGAVTFKATGIAQNAAGATLTKQ
jgi:hypothetical protein